jgi:hypothetical protein
MSNPANPTYKWDIAMASVSPGVSQIFPVHPEGQVQIPGAEQLPPFRQAGEHTVIMTKKKA